MKRFFCWLKGHRLTESVWLEVDRGPSVVKVVGWLPAPNELHLGTFSPLATHYTLRCRCGRDSDPTIRNVWYPE